MNIAEILNYIERQLYYWQVHFNDTTIHHLNHITPSALLIIFTSGIITSINPCNISILPIAASYINHSRLTYKEIYIIITGILTSFLIMIFITSIFNIYYQQLSKTTPSISYLYMIIIGLSLLNIIEFDWEFMNLNTGKEKQPAKHLNLVAKDYTVGILLGINSSSCSTPIFASLIYWITKSKFLLLGLVYIVFYILGYAVPLFLLIKLSLNSKNLVIQNRLWAYIIPIVGSCMVGTGIFLFLNNVFI